MSDTVHRLAEAELRAASARARLSTTLAAVQERIEPKRLARDTFREVTEAGTSAFDSAKRNPGSLAGVVATAGLYLARHRIAALFGGKPDKPLHSVHASDKRHKRGTS